MKIAICIPVHGDTKAYFTLHLSALLIHTAKARPDLELEVKMASSSLLTANRASLAKQALSAGADFILWMDADHTFPRDSLLRLLDHGLPVVGCNYPSRLTGKPTAIRDGRLIPTTTASAQKEPLTPAEVMGFGLCLVATDCLRKMELPWFDMRASGDSYCGEDTFFFRRLARMAGVTPMIDQKLSLEVGHITEQIVKLA